jgi:tRNA A37 methylthiotransferase MiaB
LIEGPSKDPGRWVGRSQRHELVHVAGADRANPVGQLVRARVTRANKRSLFADLESQLPAATPAAARKPGLRLPLAVS